MQLTLFKDSDKRRELVEFSVDELELSPFNPRRTRSAKSIDRLAERIQRNGYEITRALWVYKNGRGYEVFAGGTRLEAARVVGLEKVPCLLHSGYDEPEIIRLADEDNANDEYHEPVPAVDIWLSYQELSDGGWFQHDIANAKGVSQPLVSFRLALAEMNYIHSPFITNGHLNEGHARELLLCNNSDWLPLETTAPEIVQLILNRNSRPTAKQFEREVKKYNALIDMAGDLAGKLPEEWQGVFNEELEAKQPRTKTELQSIHKRINNEALEETRRQESDLEESAMLAARVESMLDLIVLGDAVDLIHDAPKDFRLLFTDPPYGKDFQSNRRIVSEKAPKIQGDNDINEAANLLAAVLIEAYERMANNGAALIWTSWEHEPIFRMAISAAGFTIKNSIVWIKPNHGSGDLDGSFAPRHERLIFATKGRPKISPRLDDVLHGGEFLGTEHPTEKPLDLMREIILALSFEGDCVIDPFYGAGSTLVAAFQTGREFWGCEIDASWHSTAREIMHDLIVGIES